MGEILLCTGRYAEVPYHFDNVCINVYCVEELCYLLANNPFIIDAQIMDPKLVEWLDEQCGLTELSHQLQTLFRRGCQPGVFVDTIMSYVNYCSREERDKVEEVLRDGVGLSEFERAGKQADYLNQNGRYRMAIMEYDALLLRLPETELSLRAHIWHNEGVAYGHLFQFESAALCFRKAYEAEGREESGILYLLSQRLCISEGEYVSFLADHGEYYELSLKVEKLYKQVRSQFDATRENRMLSALQIYREEGNTASYYEEMDRIIARLKEDYRESVFR